MDKGRREPDLKGMGSTVTAARNLGRMLQIAHVGDSRAYLLRAERLTRLTRDHTYVQMLVDAGRLTREAAAKSSSRHVLVNAVGGVNDSVRVDVEHVPLENGDRVLLCSDGLTDLVDDDAIRLVLLHASTSEEACRVLVERALVAGGRDNVTAVVASYRWDEQARNHALPFGAPDVACSLAGPASGRPRHGQRLVPAEIHLMHLARVVLRLLHHVLVVLALDHHSAWTLNDLRHRAPPWAGIIATRIVVMLPEC